jgi:hypothetical protein
VETSPQFYLGVAGLLFANGGAMVGIYVSLISRLTRIETSQDFIKEWIAKHEQNS